MANKYKRRVFDYVDRFGMAACGLVGISHTGEPGQAPKGFFSRGQQTEYGYANIASRMALNIARAGYQPQTGRVVDHEKVHGHLVAEDLNPIYKLNEGRTDHKQVWYCEHVDASGNSCGARVTRTWMVGRWSAWAEN